MALLRAGNALKRLIRSIEGSKLLEELPGLGDKKTPRWRKGCKQKACKSNGPAASLDVELVVLG